MKTSSPQGCFPFDYANVTLLTERTNKGIDVVAQHIATVAINALQNNTVLYYTKQNY